MRAAALPFSVLLLGVATASSCAHVNPKPAFDDVAAAVSDRTGRRPQWPRDAAESERAKETTKQLLRDGLTVDRAVEIALLRNPALQAEFERIGVSQADLVQSGLIANPELFGFVRFASPGSGTNTEIGITEDWLSVFLLPLRKRFAEAELEQTKLDVAARVTSLVSEVKGAYYTLVARQYLATRLRSIVEIDRIAEEFARRQFEAGTIGEIDWVNQQALVSQTRVDLAMANIDVRRGREELNRLLGLWGDETSWSVPEEIPAIPDTEIPVDRLEAFAMEQRQDLKAARWGVDIVGRALAIRKRTRFFPIGINIGVETERDLDGQRVTGPTLSVQLPIFDTGKASIARLEFEQNRAMRQLEALAINARSEVREARDLLLATRDIVGFYRTVLVPQRSRILDLTLLHYNMMLKGNYDLLLAKRSEVESEKAYIEAWREYWVARSNLERSLGGRLPETAATDASNGAQTQ